MLLGPTPPEPPLLVDITKFLFPYKIPQSYWRHSVTLTYPPPPDPMPFSPSKLTSPTHKLFIAHHILKKQKLSVITANQVLILLFKSKTLFTFCRYLSGFDHF